MAKKRRLYQTEGERGEREGGEREGGEGKCEGEGCGNEAFTVTKEEESWGEREGRKGSRMCD